MKKLFILICFAFLTKINQAQTVFFNNATNVYYGATFNTSSISGSCPTTVASNFYMDVPNGGGYSQGDFFDENGDLITNVANITGISLIAFTVPPAPPLTDGSGATYVVPFCVSSTPVNTDEDDFTVLEISSNPPDPTTVSWNIIPFANIIIITIF